MTPTAINLLPSDWTHWWIGFIRLGAGRAASRSRAVIESTSVPRAGRKFSLSPHPFCTILWPAISRFERR